MCGHCSTKERKFTRCRAIFVFVFKGSLVIGRQHARRFDLEKVKEERSRRRHAGAAVRRGLISRACRRMRSADSERRRCLLLWRYVSLQIRAGKALKWSKNVAIGKFRRFRRGLVFCSTLTAWGKKGVLLFGKIVKIPSLFWMFPKCFVWGFCMKKRVGKTAGMRGSYLSF